MTQRKCWRYKCDFCGKGGLSKHRIREHEFHCTLNPNRVCNVCANLLTKPQPMMADLVAIARLSDCLPTTEQIAALRAATGSCPACFLAAIRQAGGPMAWGEFDFQTEMKAALEVFRDAQRKQEYRECHHG